MLKFLKYLNGRHNSIKFTIEFEQAEEIPFLDILIKCCPNNTFITSVYRKKTFTGLYTKWDSFTPRKYKINLIRTPTYRCFRICSTASLLQSAVEDLKRLLLQNGYPQGIITFNINDVLNKNKNKPNEPVATVPKKDVILVLIVSTLLLMLKLFFKTPVASNLFSHTRTDSTDHNYPKSFTKLVAGTATIFTLGKRSGDLTTGKRNISRPF